MQELSLLNFLLKQNQNGLPERDFLSSLSLQYPYFSPAHFFLLKQIKEADAAFNQQAAKTQLFFNNPFWLNLQLNHPYYFNINKSASVPELTKVSETNQIEQVLPEPLKKDDFVVHIKVDQQKDLTGKTLTETGILAAASPVVQSMATVAETEIGSKTSGSAQDSIETIEAAYKEESQIPPLKKDIFGASVAEGMEKAAADNAGVESGVLVVPGAETTFKDDNARKETVNLNQEAVAPIIENQEPKQEENLSEVNLPPTAEIEPSANVLKKESGPKIDLSSMTQNEDNIDDEASIDNETESEPMILNFPLPKINYGSQGKESLLFEPMHLVDYFASQGIKLNEEGIPTDKLGKQLKSFTEWLKTMKKIHPTTTDDKNAGTELAMQVLAEKSNSEGDVLTEAMAAVFAKQGKIKKAIGVYNKLSLLNPSKSAYFAAKIKQLKG